MSSSEYTSMANDKLGEEERDILDRFERGDLRSAPEAEREMEIARQAARNSQVPVRPADHEDAS